MSDEEMFEELATGLLEEEAEALSNALLHAEEAAAVLDPDLFAALDNAASAYAEVRRTWLADMNCGDLAPDQRAQDIAKEYRKRAHVGMLGILCSDSEPDPAILALGKAVFAVHAFLDRLEGDMYEHLAEDVALYLGDSAPRYVLGF